DDAGAGAVPIRGFLLHQLDDFVAVARRFGDQRERDEPQVALRQHAPGARVVGVHAAPSAHAVPPEAETVAAETTAAMAPGAPFPIVGFVISLLIQVSLSLDISVDGSLEDVTQDISFLRDGQRAAAAIRRS